MARIFLAGGVAMKISRNLAAIGAMILLPVQGLMAQVSNTTDFLEIACAPISALSTSMEEHGYNIKRINYKGGFDLESPKGTRLLDLEMRQHPPRFSWISLPCTRLSPLVNLMAQAKELSNLLQAKALRTLTWQEWAELDYKKIMGTGWVLTSKSDGTAKSRLVVLGYQAPNLTEVQAPAPTVSRLSRNFLLMM